MSASLGIAAQLALGLVFLMSSAFKVRNPRWLATAIRSYRALPDALVGVAAGGLTATEVALAASLVTGIGDQWARPASALLLAGFLLVVGWNVRKGRDHPCGCFSPDERIGSRSLVRLVLLLLLAVTTLVMPSGGLPDAIRQSGPFTAGAVAFLAAAALAAGHMLLEVSRLFGPVRPDQATRPGGN